MTGSDHTLTPAAQARSKGIVADYLDEQACTRHLRRLATAYPAFTFSREIVSPWKGRRWVAERKDRKAPGVRCVITDDLLELHAALQKDREASHAAR